MSIYALRFSQLQKEQTMNIDLNSVVSIVARLLVLGLIVYAALKYNLLDTGSIGSKTVEKFDPSTIPPMRDFIVEGPPRTVASSGPNPPAQSSDGRIILHGSPAPSTEEPYQNVHESSEIPESMRYPERAYRPAPKNEQIQSSMDAGISGATNQGSAQNYQRYGLDTIQNSGEFMSGVYANDTSNNDASYSTF